jgi:Ca2+-binding EF-hand superfamily protein
VIDKDEDGLLERVELMRVLQRQGVVDTEDIDDVLDELDNGDGKISISQYVNHMIRTHQDKTS